MKKIVQFLLISAAGFQFSFADASCVFCKPEVIKNQSVYESQFFYVIPSFEPVVHGHLLVVPKRHTIMAHELSREEWEELSTVIPKIVKVFDEFFGTNQYIILEKNGPNAFQKVPHVHFHIVPIHFQEWEEIFKKKISKISHEQLDEQITLFRSYFNRFS